MVKSRRIYGVEIMKFRHQWMPPTSVPNGRSYEFGLRLLRKDEGYRYLTVDLLFVYMSWSWWAKSFTVTDDET